MFAIDYGLSEKGKKLFEEIIRKEKPNVSFEGQQALLDGFVKIYSLNAIFRYNQTRGKELVGDVSTRTFALTADCFEKLQTPGPEFPDLSQIKVDIISMCQEDEFDSVHIRWYVPNGYGTLAETKCQIQGKTLIEIGTPESFDKDLRICKAVEGRSDIPSLLQQHLVNDLKKNWELIVKRWFDFQVGLLRYPSISQVVKENAFSSPIRKLDRGNFLGPVFFTQDGVLQALGKKKTVLHNFFDVKQALPQIKNQDRALFVYKNARMLSANIQNESEKVTA